MFDLQIVSLVAVVYGLLSSTYVAAAIISQRMKHRLLALCYVASAFLHGMLAAYYALPL